ncbi:MAG TPA: acetoacetate--CoA ligase [Longimicrobiaceae bacterium]|nr:acetoacetate--CoA ligase [Longimicrobiaceae bacterium]
MAPAPLWTPSAEHGRGFARWLEWLARERGLVFSGYRDAWEWSTTELEAFWGSLWDFFGVEAARPYERVLAERTMPGARWYPGAELSYAAHALRHADADRPALLFASETRPLAAVGWAELRAQVAAVAAALRGMGVERGDRVAAFLPNLPEAVVAFLACAAVGAVWSSCSPDFGVEGAAARFGPLAPKVLIAADGYVHAGKAHDRRGVVAGLREALPTLAHAVLVPYLDPAAHVAGIRPWVELLEWDAPLRIDPVPFDHPLWILHSSGTTGAPKAVVHGHGGIVLEHLKALVLQQDVRPGDRVLWHTTTGWMMWNRLVGALLAGATPVLYDGSPVHPEPDALWRLAEEAGVTHFGAGAGFYLAGLRAGLRPGERFGLAALRAVGSTGSPLPPEGFRWVYEAVKADVWLASSSGGTEVATAFLGACPTLPVHAGELQGPWLGVRAQAFDDAGHPVVGREGELVITEPMPSMPLRFWNDPDGARYRESYFGDFPGAWRHGDRVTFTGRGSAVVHGRSDAALNRHGVRLGTGEIYAVVEAVPGVVDSLVVGVERPGGGYWMPLFVVLREGMELDDALRDRIRQRLRSALSPRHVPDEIVQVPAVPRTPNGKKLEVPVKRILLGAPAAEVAGPASPADPDALRWFAEWAQAPTRLA